MAMPACAPVGARGVSAHEHGVKMLCGIALRNRRQHRARQAMHQNVK